MHKCFAWQHAWALFFLQLYSEITSAWYIHTYIPPVFPDIRSCLLLSLILSSSCSVHLSSSLCGVWFVRAHDEFVYEWRELISPEWSFSLSNSFFLPVSLHQSIQSKTAPQTLSTPAGCITLLTLGFNSSQSWIGGVIDHWTVQKDTDTIEILIFL